MALKLTLAKIVADFQTHGLSLGPNTSGATTINAISAIETCSPGDLVFIDKKDYLPLLAERKPTAVVTSAALQGLMSDLGPISVIIAPNIALAHALLKQKYASRDFSRSGWQGVHPSAVIHESAEIDSTAVLEPRVVVARGVKIAAHCRIMAGTIIEHDVVIGEGSVLQPNVVVGYGTRIGREVMIGSGTVLGSEGFGYAQDKNRKSFAIPQTGIVVIEDRVHVGANCTIDRAAYAETKIGSGTKLDNLCHVAHNVQIGEDCLLTAMLCVAGSTKIGNRVMASGQTGILDHMTICDDAVFVHRAGVTKDIEKPGVYAGLPTQPLGDYMKNSAVLRGATELRKRVGDLEEKLGTTKPDAKA